MEFVYEEVEKIIGGNAGHGMLHIAMVSQNAQNMIDANGNLNDTQKMIIILASLLHDVDDHKFFENTSNAENILKRSFFSDLTTLVLFCVDCVSYSSNQNNYPKSVPPEFDQFGFNREYFKQTGKFDTKDLWILYPRFADRLEAIDLHRTLEFGQSRNRPDFNQNTPKISCLDDFEKIDFAKLEEEYIHRNCRAHPDYDSSMDHVYEKCMNLYKMETHNSWCECEKMLRHKKMMDDIVYFWSSV
jgi:hypothetical protein